MSEFDDEELSAQERHVRDLLRGAADVGPMPADVVARLDAALADARAGDRPAPGATVASLSARRRWSRRLPRLVAAAAAAVVVGGGALHLALDDGSGTSSSSSAGGGAGADSAAGSPAASEAVPPAARVLLSGTDYTDVAAVQDLGEESLTPEEGTDASSGTGAADDATPGTGADDRKPTMLNAPQSEPEGSATSDPSQLPNAERALACTRALGVDPTTVRVVEIANWRSQPAAFVVHTTPDGAQVVVVALGCSPGDEALSTVPVPQGS
ncbi:hypothetical protein [Kineococcus sp. SYSU DK002]|uniref:hypothetical protein n=1 Tax=Kineococcus sp. SYSU DK002 TaxID=3383123 RepID=UPI003D7DB6B0